MKVELGVIINGQLLVLRAVVDPARGQLLRFGLPNFPGSCFHLELRPLPGDPPETARVNFAPDPAAACHPPHPRGAAPELA